MAHNVIQFPLKKRHPVLRHIENNEKFLRALMEALDDSKKLWELMRDKK